METKEELKVKAQEALDKCNEFARVGSIDLANAWFVEYKRLIARVM
jgi:hypothetical protein